KIGLLPCGRPWLGRSLANPSGHAALSATFYGSLTLLALDRVGSRIGRVILGLLAVLAIVAIAWSRVVVHAHTTPEAALGLGAVLLSVRLFAIGRGHGPAPKLVLPLIAVLLLGGAAALYGRRAGSEDLIRHLAIVFYRWSGLCG